MDKKKKSTPKVNVAATIAVEPENSAGYQTDEAIDKEDGAEEGTEPATQIGETSMVVELSDCEEDEEYPSEDLTAQLAETPTSAVIEDSRETLNSNSSVNEEMVKMQSSDPIDVNKDPVLATTDIKELNNKTEYEENKIDNPSFGGEPVSTTIRTAKSNGESFDNRENDEPSSKQPVEKIPAEVPKKGGPGESNESKDEKEGADAEMLDATSSRDNATQPENPATAQSTGPKTLFIGNLPYNVDKDKLIDFFKDAGEVVEVRLGYHDDGRSKGYGHVDFATAEELEKVNVAATIAVEPENSERKKSLKLSTMAKKKLFIYNTMTREKEIFVPKEPGKVGMYVCGITAYDLSHLGHARAAVAFDVLYRYLNYLEYDVTYVRNFTDVDDKIIKRANENNENSENKETPIELSNRYCEEYLKDMDDLQCLRPTHMPRVSEHIDDIINMINQIMNNGCAYEVEGDVYFAVNTEKFPDYGRLSGQKLDNMKIGGRVAPDPRKKSSADFALWKAAKPGEPSWDSPWGAGRPGWHIECSAMSERILSFQFDIHGGGIDLIFPHHENEIVQCKAACPESCVTYWMHNGHVFNNKEKMSKSLGNFFTIRQITERYHALALRHFLMSTHYNSPMNYSILQLEISSEAIFYIYQTLQDSEDAISLNTEVSLEATKPNSKPIRSTLAARDCVKKLRAEFEAKMSDDLQAPLILTAAILEPLKLVNSLLTTLKKKQQKPQLLSTIQSLIELEEEVKSDLDVLGLLSSSTYSEVLRQLKEKALKRAGLTEEDVLNQIEKRTLARKDKDFATSDMIRKDLTTKGISLMDVGTETIWRPCVPPEDEQQVTPA